MATRAVAARRFFIAYYQWNNSLQRSTPFITGKGCGQQFNRQILRAFTSRKALQVEGEGAIQDPDTPADDVSWRVRRVTSESAKRKKLRLMGYKPLMTMEAAEPERLRGIMRNVPHPVVVITTSYWDAEKQEVVSQGMTVSSFNTVQIDPKPMISFNVRLPSKTYTAIRNPDPENRFNVHILKNTPDGARIADSFTRGNDERPFDLLKAAGVSIIQADRNIPKINDDSVMAILGCLLVPDKQIELDNHLVLVAEVRSIQQRESEQVGLMYVNRAYAITAPDVDAAQAVTKKPPRPSQSAVKGLLKQPAWTCRSLRTIPTKADTQLILDRIRDYLVDIPEMFEMHPSKASILVRNVFDMPPEYPISMGGLIDMIGSEYRLSQRPKSNVLSALENYGQVFDFYHTIRLEDVSVITERVKGLFQEGHLASSHSYMDILRSCGVHPRTLGLPSTALANPLREAGLIRPSRPLEELLGEQVLTLEVAEAVEGLLYSSAQETPLPELLREEFSLDWKAIMKQHNLPERHHKWERQADLITKSVTHRAVVEMLPAADFQFSGHITLEQQPLLLEHLLNEILADSRSHHHHLPFMQRLVRYQIHPGITGFDYRFVFWKFQSLKGAKLEHAVEEFRIDQLRAWGQEPEAKTIGKEPAVAGLTFNGRLTTEAAQQLHTSLKTFVDEDPCEAFELGLPGILRAIGVQPDASMLYRGQPIPVQDNPFFKAMVEAGRAAATHSEDSGAQDLDSSEKIRNLARIRGDAKSGTMGQDFNRFMTEDSDNEGSADAGAQGEEPIELDAADQVLDRSTNVDAEHQKTGEQSHV